MAAPRLSVLIPTFNRLSWLPGAMDSVLAAGLDLELIVLDNGSSDGTWDFLQERARLDSRIRPLRWEVNNAGESYPALLELARGEYVNFFADDDEMIPGGLARKMAVLDAHPSIGMVFSPVLCMDGQGQDLGEGAWTVFAEEDFLGRKDLFESLIVGNFVPMPAAMFRRELSPTGVILRNPAYIVSHDWQFWLDLVQRTETGFLREPTVRLRMHEGQVSIVDGVRQGYFAEVNLRIWRHWMVETDPPYIPSANAWGVMTRTLYHSLHTAYGQDMEKIQEGLRRLQATRGEQEAMISGRREAAEAAQSEAFLLEFEDSAPGGETPGWEDIVRTFVRTFSREEPAALLLLWDPDRAGPSSLVEMERRVAEAVDGTGKTDPPVVRVVPLDLLFKASREYPYFQRIAAGTASSLEGIKGRRLASALQTRTGAVQS